MDLCRFRRRPSNRATAQDGGEHSGAGDRADISAVISFILRVILRIVMGMDRPPLELD